MDTIQQRPRQFAHCMGCQQPGCFCSPVAFYLLGLKVRAIGTVFTPATHLPRYSSPFNKEDGLAISTKPDRAGDWRSRYRRWAPPRFAETGGLAGDRLFAESSFV